MGPVDTLERVGIAGLRLEHHLVHQIDRVIHFSVDPRRRRQFHCVSVCNVVLPSFPEMPEDVRLFERYPSSSQVEVGPHLFFALHPTYILVGWTS